MKKIAAIFVFALVLSGCGTAKPVRKDAQDNANPASPPVVQEWPISSAQWPESRGSLFITRKDFAVQVWSSYLNELNVTYGGKAAVELVQGSMPRTPANAIKVSQLQPGNVYFRLSPMANDVPNQKQSWLLEIVDLAGVLTNFPDTPISANLVVRERSVNPQYAATPDEFKESTTIIQMDPRFVQPQNHAGLSQCKLRYLDPSRSITPVDPGQVVKYGIRAEGCRSVLISGSSAQTTQAVADLPSTAGADINLSITISPSARISELIEVTGYDQLRRTTILLHNQKINTTPAPPALACDASNGFDGQTHTFQYCASCDNEASVPLSVDACTDAAARDRVSVSLRQAAITGCTLHAGSCTACPVSNSNPVGQAQPFPYCAAAPDSQLGYTNLTDGMIPACSRAEADAGLARYYPGYEIQPSLSRTFNVCTTCPDGTSRSLETACSADQAIALGQAYNSNPACKVKICP